MRLRWRHGQEVDYRARYLRVALRHSAALTMACRLARSHDGSTSSVARRLAQTLVALDEHMRTHHGYPVPSLWNGTQLVEIHRLEHELLDRRTIKFEAGMTPHTHGGSSSDSDNGASTPKGEK